MAAPAGSGRDAARAAGQESRVLPWLHNFAVTAETAEARSDVVARMARWREPDESCSAAAYGGLAITADVAKVRGPQLVMASFTQGVLVLDADGRLIASATALACQGSADEIDGIAAGDAHIDRPVIALAVTTGGHRTSSTWLVLYGVTGGVIAPLFTGRVEDHDGERTRAGVVVLLPGALLYRAPSGTQTMWVYNAEQQRYVELALVVPPPAV
ncbi:MAG TPA: hypothetical protein VF469_28665 [Kofleriaceae bacterium]